MARSTLLACRDCDLLHRVDALRPGTAAYCRRCGATLQTAGHTGPDVLLALAAASLIMYAIANAFPFLGMELSGQVSRTTLAGGAAGLWTQGYVLLSTLVFITTILVPGLQIALLLWVLAPLSMGRLPWKARTAFRSVQQLRPWGMAEVFLLGIIVSVVKLADLAQVLTGPALWALAALVVLLAASAVLLNPADLWARLEEAP